MFGQKKQNKKKTTHGSGAVTCKAQIGTVRSHPPSTASSPCLLPGPFFLAISTAASLWFFSLSLHCLSPWHLLQSVNELQAPVAQLLCVLCLWPSVLHWHQASNVGAQTRQKVHWRLGFGFILHYWRLLKIHSFFAKSVEVCWPAPKQYQVLLCVDVLVPVRALQALIS